MIKEKFSEIHIKNLIQDYFTSSLSKTNFHNLTKRKDIIIYGHGNGYYSFHEFVLKKYKINPKIIIDKKYKKKKYSKKIIYTNLEKINELELNKNNLVFIITIGNKDQRKKVKKNLKKLGFSKILDFEMFYDYHLAYEKNFETRKKIFFVRNIREIIEAFKKLKDKKSKKIFIKILKIFLMKKILKINSNNINDQFFPKDIKLLKSYNIFFNCGAFNGDTILQLKHNRINAKKIYCFEPNKASFKKLKLNIKKNFKRNKYQIKTFNIALWNKKGVIGFSKNQGTVSNIQKSSKNRVKLDTIDNIVKVNGDIPSMINFDIEGAEFKALQGAKITIKNHHPDLAISTYHHPGDFWKIINLVSSYNKKYNFYLRNYTGFVEETILYATQ